ncbi:hypothetical protein MANES_13G087301v8 [Manihot esculenta]|uniref:Uncharacterized protein n=1 Tax=Manihot esculenta TaxID=3983 RepID=A0ACB7GL83_MANES|nr:hypothetical protein MANES_13G087301v8 [Manihot esculenta]
MDRCIPSLTQRNGPQQHSRTSSSVWTSPTRGSIRTKLSSHGQLITSPLRTRGPTRRSFPHMDSQFDGPFPHFMNSCTGTRALHKFMHIHPAWARFVLAHGLHYPFTRTKPS